MKFSINQVKQGLGEVQSTLRWSVNIINPAPAVGALPPNLQVRVQTTGLPNADVQTMKVELGGHTINYNGKVIKAGELPWKLVEGSDAQVITYFYKWLQARWGGDGKDTTGKAKTTAECKADVEISLLDHNDKATITYILTGAMPKIENGDELGQTADPFSPVATWEYDDFHVKTAGLKY